MSVNPCDSDSLPSEVCDHVFSFLTAADCAAARAVARSWRAADRRSRRRLTIRDAYAVAPQVAVEKFPNVRAVVVKSDPPFVHCTPFRPRNAQPWVVAAAAADGWPDLEELSFEGMVVTDDCLHTIAAAFAKLKVLRINDCNGFSTTGLVAIAQGCSNLRELDLEWSQQIDNNPSEARRAPIELDYMAKKMKAMCMAWEMKDMAKEQQEVDIDGLPTLKRLHREALLRGAR